MLGRCCRGRMCGIGPVEAVLHIRSEPAGGGSAESCGNAPVFNAVEILPCADRGSLHMKARALKTTFQEESRNHEENPESSRGGAALQCATPRNQWCAPTGSASRAPPAPAAAIRVRDVVRVRGSAMTGDDPQLVRNGAPGGSFRPAPGDRLDETAELCGCRRGCLACGGGRSSRSTRTGAGAPPPAAITT